MELTLISLSESSLFKDLRRPLGPFFFPARIQPAGIRRPRHRGHRLQPRPPPWRVNPQIDHDRLVKIGPRERPVLITRMTLAQNSVKRKQNRIPVVSAGFDQAGSLFSIGDHDLCGGRRGRRSHRLQHAAVDEVGRTDAVGRLVRAEENEEVGELLGAGESPDGCVLVGDALQIALPVASLAGRQLFCRLDPVGRLDGITGTPYRITGLRGITGDCGGLRRITGDYGDAISNPTDYAIDITSP